MKKQENEQQSIRDLKLEVLHLRMELSEIKERYDSLCVKLKHNANDARN